MKSIPWVRCASGNVLLSFCFNFGEQAETDPGVLQGTGLMLETHLFAFLHALAHRGLTSWQSF